MDILHVIPSLDPSSGGPPRVTTRLAAAQAELGHHVVIASYAMPGGESRFAEMTGSLPCFDRVPQFFFPSGGWGEVFYAKQSRAGMSRLIHLAQVVHLHGVWESFLRVAGAYAHQIGRPYFVQPNGMLDPWALQQRRFKKQIALALAYRRIIENASGLILGHISEERLIRRLAFNTAHHIVPLNAVFMNEIDPLPEPGRFYQRFPALQGHPFLVFLSRLHYKKGLDYLADAFALAAPQIPDLHLVVVGHDEGAREDFERRIAAAGLTPRVHLVGPMHGQAKWEAFRDAQAFILPSRQEGFSIAITEALASGLPVIVTKPCNFEEVEEAQAGYVTDLDTGAVGHAIVQLFSDPQRRAQMARNARQLVLDRFECHKMAQATIDIYQQATV